MIRRINLLPPEIAERRRGRQRRAAMAAAGVALVALYAGVYVLQETRLRGERDRLAEQQRTNAQLRAKVAELAQFESAEAELKRKEGLVGALTKEEVRWSVLLADVSLVIPADVWLTALSGTVQEQGEAATKTVGQITMSGTTFTHLDVAKWLTRLATAREFFFPYISLSAKATLFAIPIVNFNSTVQLSPSALRANQKGAERKP